VPDLLHRVNDAKRRMTSWFVKVAFGAKRTNRDVSLRPRGSKMTRTRHRPDRNPTARQSPALAEVCYLWPKPLEAVKAQLIYDELRLLRQLERGDQTISDNQPRGGLDRLVDEGYV